MEEVNPERLLETAVVSMLRTLDPYTEYQVSQRRGEPFEKRSRALLAPNLLRTTVSCLLPSSSRVRRSLRRRPLPLQVFIPFLKCELGDDTKSRNLILLLKYRRQFRRGGGGAGIISLLRVCFQLDVRRLRLDGIFSRCLASLSSADKLVETEE